MKPVTMILLMAGTAAACAGPDAGGTFAATAPSGEAITEAGLRADVFALADDSLRGRLVGTPEIERAADWVAARFAAEGLEPAGDAGSHDQRFDLTWFSAGANNTLRVDGASRAIGDGWYPLNFSGTGEATGEVVFAGFGIVEPQLGWDDYRGADVSGKVVLVLEREPGVAEPASPFDGVVTAESSRDWRKALAAQQRGAVAILFVRDVQNRAGPEDWARATASYWPAERRRVERFALREWMERITIPGATISTGLARTLVAGSGRTLDELAAAAETAEFGLGVIDLPGGSASLHTAVERHTTPGRNIVGKVTGTDPALRDEAVLIIGHHDHNGAEGDTIFNGADDNASGAVGVMAVAAAYARAAHAGQRPRRTVVFAITDAEERGPSLGAWHLSMHPPVPLANIAAVLNVDMIGRNQEVPTDGGGRFAGLEPQSAESNSNALNILGYSRAPELAAAVEAANTSTALTLRMRYDNNPSNLLRRSDQWPFLQNGVPAVWFHTGLHPDYHTADDDAERINYEKMARIVRLIHQVSWNVANADGRPRVEPMGARPAS